jgi:hypothetical protein
MQATSETTHRANVPQPLKLFPAAPERLPRVFETGFVDVLFALRLGAGQGGVDLATCARKPDGSCGVSIGV